MKTFAFAVLGLAMMMATAVAQPAGDAALGSRSYENYERPEVCADCHLDFTQQWRQAMMSQAFTHPWDEIEYFRLALPHSALDPKVAGVKAGCNGCHAPLAFLAGDIPPSRPAAGTRANESVSCDLCHTLRGFEGELPYNFNWITEPGDVKVGPKAGADSPFHQSLQLDFVRQSEFCGTCHNEQSPYGVWVKATHLEWRDGPYAAEGVRCQDCHMPAARGLSAEGGREGLVAQHLFNGAHDAGKLAGAVELRLHPDRRELPRGQTVKFTVQITNAKAGHMIPTGSVEDRLVWLHLTAVDAAGRRHHLSVDPKGFEGEEYTIAAQTLAYQDLGIPLERPGFPGVERDGLPLGDRIFRMPYFDPQGRMTIMQWNTASLGVDYRLAPRETKLETYTWTLPADMPPGRVQIQAELNYRKLVGPVAELLEVPADETAVQTINRADTWIAVLD